MDNDVLADTTYGKLALAKLKPKNKNFRLYEAGWLGKGNEREVMEIKGAIFRIARSGPRKGKLCILIKGTECTTYITASELQAKE